MFITLSNEEHIIPFNIEQRGEKIGFRTQDVVFVV